MRKVENDINAKMFYALKVSEVSKVPFLFISVPGMGKSTSVEMFAAQRGYELVILRGNSTSESEIMGYDVVDAANPASKSTKHLRPAWYEQVMYNHANGKKTLLFLDEITTASEWVQSALLHLIFERKVGMESIPEDTLIVSAGNYSQSLGNNFGLIPPLMNRFCIYNIVPTVKDLDIFLNEHDGAIVGKPKNKMEGIKKLLEGLDNMSVDITDEDMAKVGEYFERGIREQTKVLMTSGKKVIDLAVSDMQSLYQDVNNDALLKGFVTFRTLNYLKRVTLAAYKCFGKEGLVCPAYRLIVQGLCGIGLSRDTSTKNVIVSDVDKDYYDQISLITEEVEKLKNSAVPMYEKFFKQALGEIPFENGEVFPGIKKGKTAYSDVQLNLINCKIEEMMKDPAMKNIQRPIDQDVLDGLSEVLINRAVDIQKSLKIDTTNPKNATHLFTVDSIVSLVVSWNYVNDLLKSLRDVVCSDSLGYSETSLDKLKKTAKDINRNFLKIRAVLNMYKKNSEVEAELIPELKTTGIDDLNSFGSYN